jgi:nucleoside-diphosphate-sugar epimerase
MRVRVTGAGGLVGAAIARRLGRASGLQVWRAGRGLPDAPQTLTLDLNDPAAARRALAAANPDVVIHAAGRRRGTASELSADNVQATEAVAEAIGRAAPGAGLIFIGSAAQYGPSSARQPWRESQPCAPASPYGHAKLEAEQAAAAAAQRHGFRFTSLRLFNLVAPAGEGDDVLSEFLRGVAAQQGQSPARVRTGPLGAVRDFVRLEDFLGCVERALAREVWGQTINICTGVGRPVRSLLELVACGVGGVAIEEEDAGQPGEGLDWSVGDPARCVSLLGFAPSADLGAVASAAAEWLRAARGAPDARSHA